MISTLSKPPEPPFGLGQEMPQFIYIVMFGETPVTCLMTAPDSVTMRYTHSEPKTYIWCFEDEQLAARHATETQYMAKVSSKIQYYKGEPTVECYALNIALNLAKQRDVDGVWVEDLDMLVYVK